MEQYDTLVETSSKANALTQVVLAVTDLDLVPTEVLHDFLWALDDMLYQMKELCHSLKPQPPQQGFSTQTLGGTMTSQDRALSKLQQELTSLQGRFTALEQRLAKHWAGLDEAYITREAKRLFWQKL